MVVATLFGCSKKNTPSPNPTPIVNLVGKWKTTADTLYVYQNSVLTKTYPFTADPAQLSDYQFNQDGSVLVTWQSSDPSSSVTATYTLKGSVVTFNFPTQVISGSTIAAYSENATVKLFSNDKMEIIYDDIVTDNGIT